MLNYAFVNLNSRWCMGDAFEENGVAFGLWLSTQKKLRSTRSMDLLNLICVFLGQGISGYIMVSSQKQSSLQKVNIVKLEGFGVWSLDNGFSHPTFAK